MELTDSDQVLITSSPCGGEMPCGGAFAKVKQKLKNWPINAVVFNSLELSAVIHNMEHCLPLMRLQCLQIVTN